MSVAGTQPTKVFCTSPTAQQQYSQGVCPRLTPCSSNRYTSFKLLGARMYVCRGCGENVHVSCLSVRIVTSPPTTCHTLSSVSEEFHDTHLTIQPT